MGVVPNIEQFMDARQNIMALPESVRGFLDAPRLDEEDLNAEKNTFDFGVIVTGADAEKLKSGNYDGSSHSTLVDAGEVTRGGTDADKEEEQNRKARMFQAYLSEQQERYDEIKESIKERTQTIAAFQAQQAEALKKVEEANAKVEVAGQRVENAEEAAKFAERAHGSVTPEVVKKAEDQFKSSEEISSQKAADLQGKSVTIDGTTYRVNENGFFQDDKGGYPSNEDMKILQESDDPVAKEMEEYRLAKMQTDKEKFVFQQRAHSLGERESIKSLAELTAEDAATAQEEQAKAQAEAAAIQKKLEEERIKLQQEKIELERMKKENPELAAATPTGAEPQDTAVVASADVATTNPAEKTLTVASLETTDTTSSAPRTVSAIGATNLSQEQPISGVSLKGDFKASAEGTTTPEAAADPALENQGPKENGITTPVQRTTSGMSLVG